MTAPLLRGRLHYGWIVAAVTFLILLAAAGIRSAPGVMIVPLEQEFGWDRATISLAISLNILLFGLWGPFAAAFMERFGMRRVMLTAAVHPGRRRRRSPRRCSLPGNSRCSGACSSGWAPAPWLAGSARCREPLVRAATRPGGRPADRRQRHRPACLPAAAGHAGGTSAGARRLSSSRRRGAGDPAGGAVPARFAARRGLRPYGAAPDAPRPPTASPRSATRFGGVLYAHGVDRIRDFWYLAGSFFICGASTNGLIGTHLIPASMEHGIPEVTAASMLALIGIFDLIGTTVSGWLSDRFDNRWLLFWYYSLRGLSLLFLPYAYGHRLFWPGPVRRLLRAGLGRDGAADGAAGRRHLRQGARRAWCSAGSSASHQLGAAAIAFAPAPCAPGSVTISRLHDLRAALPAGGRHRDPDRALGQW